MMLCFGASWPFNVVKSYEARSAKKEIYVPQALKNKNSEHVRIIHFSLAVRDKEKTVI